MIRTQIYLDEELHRNLLTLARHAKESMAQVARELLQEGVEVRRSGDRSGKRVMRAIANLHLSGGPNDLSTNLDHYLYGAPKKS